MQNSPGGARRLSEEEKEKRPSISRFRARSSVATEKGR